MFPIFKKYVKNSFLSDFEPFQEGVFEKNCLHSFSNNSEKTQKLKTLGLKKIFKKNFVGFFENFCKIFKF